MSICGGVIERFRKLDTFKTGEINKVYPVDIIMGYLDRDNQYFPTNTLIVNTKYYILKSKQN